MGFIGDDYKRLKRVPTTPRPKPGFFGVLKKTAKKITGQKAIKSYQSLGKAGFGYVQSVAKTYQDNYEPPRLDLNSSITPYSRWKELKDR